MPARSSAAAPLAQLHKIHDRKEMRAREEKRVARAAWEEARRRAHDAAAARDDYAAFLVQEQARLFAELQAKLAQKDDFERLQEQLHRMKLHLKDLQDAVWERRREEEEAERTATATAERHRAAQAKVAKLDELQELERVNYRRQRAAAEDLALEEVAAFGGRLPATGGGKGGGR